MSKFIKFLMAAVSAVFVVGSITACAPAEKLDLSSYAAVIDVRTPEEVAAGYLEGALTLDIQNQNFESELAKLDPAANYIIYCRSGNRAGQAITKMQGLGFTGKLVNAGSVAEAASQTGLPVIQ